MTIRRSMLPPRFWAAIDLATPLSPMRLVLFWLLSLASLVFILTTLHILAAWNEGGWVNVLGDLVNAATRSFTPVRSVLEKIRELLPFQYGYQARIFDVNVEFLFRVVPAVMTALLLGTVVPLLLGETLARTRIRRIHLLRAVAYSVPFTGLCTMVLFITTLVAERARPMSDRFAPIVGLVACSVLMAWWWHSFARYYLRIAHAWGVAAAATVVGSLGTFIILLWLTILR
jgi:hypothetical protein